MKVQSVHRPGFVFVIRGTVLTAFTLLAAGVLAAVPVRAQTAAPSGERLMLRCQTCHAVKPGGPAKVGPTLHKLFGRKAGAVLGYRYSPSLAKSGIIWNDKTLDQWLQKPTSVAAGTTMAFVGLPKAEDRAALIAYLKKTTK